MLTPEYTIDYHTALRFYRAHVGKARWSSYNGTHVRYVDGREAILMEEAARDAWDNYWSLHGAAFFERMMLDSETPVGPHLP